MTNTAEFQKLLRKKLFMPRVLWFAMTMSMFIYVLMAYMVASRPGGEPQVVSESVRLALYIVAGILGLIALSSKLFYFTRERLEKALAKPLTDDQLVRRDQQGNMDEALLEKIRGLPEKQQKILQSLNWCFAPFITTLAIAESVVILGLILAFMTYNLNDLIPFACAGLFLNLLMFNQPRAVVDEAERILR